MQTHPTPFEIALQLIKELLEWHDGGNIMKHQEEEFLKTINLADKFLDNYSEILHLLNYSYEDIENLC